MKYLNLVFTPTRNRRLNELVGFLLLVCAGLLFLALASYSPLDASFNTAGRSPSLQPPHNWIGMAGAFSSDLLLQAFGIAVFLWPVTLAMLGMRWWKSQPVNSPLPKIFGALALLTFTSALLGLLPWHWRWIHALPIEGLLGRIVGDFLIHYFNLAGAYILSLSIIAAAMYVSTAFSFNALRLWCETRFAFAYALHNRYQDWHERRAKTKAARDLDRLKATKPVVTSQLVPKPGTATASPLTSKAVSIYEPDVPLPQR